MSPPPKPGVRVQLDTEGMRALTTPAIEAAVEDIALAAGKGFVGDVVQGRTRPHGVVRAATLSARIRNARGNTLLKAMGAARR